MAEKPLPQRFIDWVKSFFRSEVRRHPPMQQPTPPQPERAPDQSASQRYQVEDAGGQTVSGSDTLKEAHEQWQELTDQKGRIIDTRTGQDVTPEPDDDGRFVVLDEQNKQLSSFDDLEKAIDFWEEVTDKSGKVIDLVAKEDVTPKDDKPYLNDEQLQAALQLVQGGGFYGVGEPDITNLGIDPDLVRRMMVQINRLPLPIFDVANIRGSGRSMPTKTVPIKRRKVTIKKVRREVEVERPGPRSPSKRVFVPYPTDEREQRTAEPGDIPRLRARDLILPRRLLGHRLVSGDLSVDQDVEEIPGQPTVRKRKEWQEFEEPDVKEWTEDVEVSEDSRDQKLAVRLDVSGSMTGAPWGSPQETVPRVNVAIALIALLIGKHLDDNSEYWYAQFADEVGRVTRARTPHDKRELVTFLITQEGSRLGGGTQILKAIQSAADDVRSASRHEDVPEILVISDGDDMALTAMDIYEAIGQDCVLHAVITNGNGGASAIQRRASTYRRIWWDGNRVRDAGDEGMDIYRDDPRDENLWDEW